MTFNWRELPPQALEQHFNPRVACADAQAHLDRFTARSAEARKHVPGDYDVRYGTRPKETLDVHAPHGAGGSAPLVLFVHGGYWRALDKADHIFVVPPLLASGAVVANVNYDLCPAVSLDVIVEEIAAAVHFCHTRAREWGADPDALYLVGHSAGAHLAAAMLQRDAASHGLPEGCIRGVAAITGIYEPSVILGVSVNQEARIDATTAARHDCLSRPFTLTPRMLVAVGGAEPEGWQAQSRDFAAACERSGLSTRLMVAPGANHFTVLEQALESGKPLNRALLGLWS